MLARRAAGFSLRGYPRPLKARVQYLKLGITEISYSFPTRTAHPHAFVTLLTAVTVQRALDRDASCDAVRLKMPEQGFIPGIR